MKDWSTYVQIVKGRKNGGCLGRLIASASDRYCIELPNSKKVYLKSSESFIEYASVSQHQAGKMFKYAQRKL